MVHFSDGTVTVNIDGTWQELPVTYVPTVKNVKYTSHVTTVHEFPDVVAHMRVAVNSKAVRECDDADAMAVDIAELLILPIREMVEWLKRGGGP